MSEETSANNNRTIEKQIDSDGFFWQDYLEATQNVEVPHIMFHHVEDTLQNGIEIGMALEVPIKNNDTQDEQYWIATIVMACGPLLRLRYLGADVRSLEFWFNLTKEAGHELGWTLKNNKKLEPPDVVKEMTPDCQDKVEDFLSKTKSVPVEMLSGEGLSIIDRIKAGMKVEVSDVRHPYKLWVATIKENVGGRLLLQYDTPGTLSKTFWMFCTSEHLHQYGFFSKASQNYFFEPPSSIVDIYSYEEWKELTENGSKDYETSNNLFNNNMDHAEHNFKLGMKLEAVSPADKSSICPATVVKVFDNIYFLVKIDTYNKEKLEIYDENYTLTQEKDQEKSTWLCTSEHPYIFPIGWAKQNNISLKQPSGWNSESNEFNWEEYLEATKCISADKSLFSERESASEAGYECEMRLEAVDPQNKEIVCAAHITKIIDNLFWIKLDCFDNRPDYIVHMHSLQIFPVGWCDSNQYPLKPPKDYIKVCQKEECSKDSKKISIIDPPISEPRNSLWCPEIYFNYRCYTGPMISKGKLATLPKSVGPGPVNLVMKEVLSMIVSVGYRSARILRVLQCDTKPEPGYNLEVLKAKYKNNTYRASVAVVTSGDMVKEFCRNICKKLMVCPNLFGPLSVENENCPDKCQKSSKNKFLNGSNGGVVTGKRGKPKSFVNILENKTKASSGKQKKKKGKNSNQDKEDGEDIEQDEEMPFLSMEKNPSDSQDFEEDGGEELKQEIQSSNVSEDSRSSFNDRKSKDSIADSPGSSSGSKLQSIKSSQSTNANLSLKREHGWETSVESDGSDNDAEYVKNQKKQRRPKTRKLDSNPLFWTVDDVFRYLKKTNDCKEIAYRIKQEEIDGLAFLLLNLPSLTQHMKLRTSAAMKLCRHIEQVKVTYFIKHINEVEP